MAHLQCSAVIAAPRTQVFDYMCDAQNIPYLLQDSMIVEVVNGEAELRRGAEASFLVVRFGFSQHVRWKIEDVLKGSRLTYRQSEGLFKVWVHTLKFEDHGEGSTLVTDLVEYELPFGLLGHLADDLILRSDIRGILNARLARAARHFSGNEGDEEE